MKKITLKKDEKVIEFIVFDNIEAKNNIVTTRCIDGSLMAFSLLEDRIITIEPYEEPRDWCIVLGLGSNRIYARMTEFFTEGYEAMINKDLTEEEAMTMAEEARLALGMDDAE